MTPVDWPEGRAIPWSVRNAHDNGVGYKSVIMQMTHASARKDKHIAELEARILELEHSFRRVWSDTRDMDDELLAHIHQIAARALRPGTEIESTST